MKAFVVRPCVIACAEKANYIYIFLNNSTKSSLARLKNDLSFERKSKWAGAFLVLRRVD